MTDAAQLRGEARPFQADVARLLELVVHSIYSDRDVFLRELISNSADACEKLRFEIASGRLPAEASPQAVTIRPDKAQGLLTIEDNGIGMNADDLEASLGVIANSGTRAFVEALEAEKPGAAAQGLIGKFGIGFYSAFMVAGLVEVFARKAGEAQGWLWTSDGASAYSIAPTDDAPEHGARIVLRLKDDAREYLERHVLERVVSEHSAGAPIEIRLEIPAEGETPAQSEVLANGAALWTRPRAEITPEQYAEFYRAASGRFDEPALTLHWRAEGRREFDALVFIPSARPFDLFHPSRKGDGRLYVRRILVDGSAELLPSWLRFAYAIVDSADIPLNVSREMTQASPVLASIRKALVNRVLQELTKLAGADDEAQRERYGKIWADFGAVLKEGLYEDPERRDALLALARFSSLRHPGGDLALKDYVASMRENQTAIYYLTGADREELAASPHLEALRAHGVDALLLTDPVDAFWTSNVSGYEGKPFRSAAQTGLDLSAIPLAEGEAAPQKREVDADDARLLARLKQALEAEVADVRASDLLATSAARLAAPEHGMDRTLARILGEAGKGSMPPGMESKPTLEVNLAHPLLRRLAAAQESGQEDGHEGGQGEAVGFDDLSGLIVGLARIAEGELPAHPARFSRKLAQALGAPAAGDPAA